MTHDVFISHSSIDKSIADAVTASLEQSQVRCWIAPRDILAGESWGGSIISAIESSEIMVIVFSSHSNDSKQVMREVERAVQKDVVVVPFRVENIQPSRDMEYFLSATHWLDAVSPEMDAHLAALVNTVQTLLNKSSAPSAPSSPVSSKERFVKSRAIPLQAQVSETAAPKKSRGKLPMFTSIVAFLIIAAAGFWIFGGSGSSSPSKYDGRKIEQKETGDIDLEAADNVIAAEQMTVDWNGDAAEKDIIMIAKKDAQDTAYLQRVIIKSKRPIDISVPDAPGKFEIRFMDAASRTVIARRDLTVELPKVSLASPDEAGAGAPISVDWVAPNNKGDYLSIAAVGSQDKDYASYAYTARGSPTVVRLPDLAGAYELRYVSTKTDVVWARKPLKVLDHQVTLEIPETAIAGEELMIEWTGPANKGDYLSVAELGSKGNKYLNYIYVKPTTPAKLAMPELPGKYEVRYISAQAKLVWESQPIEISQPLVSISMPQTAVAGSKVALDWQGPANKGDYIAVADVDSEPNKYHSYQYVKPGAKIIARMPDTAGDYVVRYVSGQKRHLWAEVPIKVVKRSETLTHPKAVPASKKFAVSWVAKGNQGDYLGVYKAGSENKDYVSYAQARNKVKLTLKAPAEAGDYELRYISGQQKLVWATSSFKVE